MTPHTHVDDNEFAAVLRAVLVLSGSGIASMAAIPGRPGLVVGMALLALAGAAASTVDEEDVRSSVSE